MTKNNTEADFDPSLDDFTSVFFSYSRVDQAKAIPMIQAIEAAGYKVWWDGMLEVGSSFLDTTEEALESAKAVVVLWSKTSVMSHWVRDEATSGRVRNRLVPLSLDGTEAPLGFRQVQLIDMQNWSGRHDGPAMVQIKKVLAQYHDIDAPDLSVSKPALRPPTISRRNVLLGGSSVGLLSAIAGFLTLNQLSSGSKTSSNSLAVMPFRNLSRDPEVDYLASGLASELRTTLARNQALKIAARSSSEAVAIQELSATEVSKRLGVGKIVEGQLEKIGTMLRITMELIDGKSGFTSDVKVFEHAFENTIRFRNEIADSISNLLTVQMSNDMFEAKSGATQNAAAFNEYLKGMDIFLSNRGVEPTRQALSHIDKALEFDPQFGSAQSARARMLLYLGGTARDPKTAEDHFRTATQVARKSVELSPELAEAHSTLGNVLFSANLNLKAAKAPYLRARQLGAGNAEILGRFASYMAVTGQEQEAREAILLARDLDPLNLTMHRISGLVNYSARRYPKAIADYRHIIETDPSYWGGQGPDGTGSDFFRRGPRRCVRMF